MDAKKAVIACLAGFGFCLGFCALCYWQLRRSTAPSRQLKNDMSALQENYRLFQHGLVTESESLFENVENALKKLRMRERRAKDGAEDPSQANLDLGGEQLRPEEIRAKIFAGYVADGHK